jgi:hypothetical protein
MSNRKAAVVFIALLALLFSACSSNQVISDLQLAIDAVSIALPLVGPTVGLPAALVSQIDTYLSATSQAVSQAADILAGPGNDTSKAAAIAGAFAGIAAPIVPPQYASIANAVQQVAQAVQTFLAAQPAAAANVVYGKTTKLSNGDKADLVGIKAKAAECLAKLPKR